MLKYRKQGDLLIVYLINEHNERYFEGKAWLRDKNSIRSLINELEDRGVSIKKDWFD